MANTIKLQKQLLTSKSEASSTSNVYNFILFAWKIF